MNRFLVGLTAVGALCSVLLAPPSAFAQTSDPAQAATAQVLYDQATDEMDDKDYVSASKKLVEVVKLVPDALGAKMKLAECYEALGKSASAWSQYVIVEALAPKQQQTERAKKASERAAALKPILAMLTVEVPTDIAATPGLVITRDGVPMGEGQWGTPLPVDPGPHEITAAAPSHKAWIKHVEVLGNGAKLSVRVEPLPADSASKDDDALTSSAVARPWQRPLGLGVAAVGAAGLVAGAVAGGISILKRDASNNGACDKQNFCEPDGIGLRNEALASGIVSTAAFIAGGLFAGAGVVLLLTAPRDRKVGIEKKAELFVSPGGFGVVGRF